MDPERVTEDGGRQTVTVTAMLNAGARTADTVVQVSVAGETATVVDDFGAVGNFSITIPANQPSGEADFPLTPVNDAIAEGDETLQVSGTSALPVTAATLTISDDDIASSSIALSLEPERVTENGGAQTVTVSAMLNAGARTADTVVSVSVAEASATEGTDFAAVANFQITIPANQRNGEADFSVTPVNDTIAEGDETLQVSGAATGLTVDGATLTIGDDDTASTGIELTLNPERVSEQGGQQTVTVTAALDAGARTGDTLVNVTVAGDTATAVDDFQAAPSFTVTIPATQTSGQNSFALTPVNDAIAEGNETLTVSGTSALPVTGAELTISDDDTASTGIALMLDPVRVTEQGGQQTVTVTAMLDAGARAADTVVNVTVAGDTATVVDDFAAVQGFQITIPATEASATSTFLLTPVNDTTAEGDETLQVSGSATGLTVDGATLVLGDDDTASTGIALMLDPVRVTEQGGQQTVTVTAMLDAGARAADTVVNVTVAGDTATVVDDFAAVQGFQITIPATEASATSTFLLTPVNDTTAEGDETLQVSGSATGLTVDGATLVLGDDDTASTGIALTLDPVRVTEQGGQQTVTVTATLDAGARTEDTVVNVTVAGDTATVGDDFGAVSDFSITIRANQPSGQNTFALTPFDDAIAEGEETLTVSGTATDLTVTPATLTIGDDDTASTGIALTLDPERVSEQGGQQTVTVTAALDAGARTGDTLVNVTVAGDTATAVDDFQAVPSFTVTIPATQTSGQNSFALTPVNDAIAEGNETLTVSGTSALPVTGAELTISDDDTASTGIALMLDPVRVTEQGGQQTVTVTAMLDAGARAADTVVNVTVAGDTATVVDDFAVVQGFQITIPAGASSGEAEFSVTPVNDAIAEGEETLTVRGTSALTVTPATLTLADDDTASTGIALTLDPVRVTEQGGQQTVTVTAMLNAGARTEDTVVQVSVAGDTATVVEDFQTVSSFTVTIPANRTSGEADFPLTPVNDAIAEGDETLQVSGTSALPVTAATLTISDDDTTSSSIALSLEPERVTENGGAQTVTVTAMLDAGTRTADTVVSVSVAGASATEGTDFAAVGNFQITIPANQADGSGTFSLTPVNDTLAEGEETLTVSGTATGLTVDPATLTLADDDTASTGIALTLDPEQVTEQGGRQTVRVTAMLDAGARTEDTVVSVSVAGASATEGTDFTAVGNFQITIPANQADGSGTFSLTPVNDTLAEGEETLTVSGTATGLTVDPATLTLADDDTASTGIALTLDPEQVTEQGGRQTVRVTAMLDAGARTEDTVVSVSVAGASATEGTDFRAVGNFPITIPATETSATGAFTVTPVDDAIAEGEETLTVSGAATGLTVDPATLTITDDDTAANSIELTLDPEEVTENGGEQTVTVTATLNGGARAAETNVKVSVAGVTATAGADFTAVQDVQITIPAGAASGEADFTLTPVNDVLAEGDETLTVSGTATGLTVDPATLTITDDDDTPRGITLSVSPESVAEDAGETVIEVTAMLAGETTLTADTEVTLTVADGSATAPADYSAAGAILTIVAGSMSGTAAATVTPVDDALVEGPETVEITGDAGDLSVRSVAATIEDGDELTASVAADAVTVIEGDPATFTVSLTGGSATAPVEVQYGMEGTATEGEDYAAPAGRLTIAAEAAGGTITIQTTADAAADPGETLAVVLRSARTAKGTVVVTPEAATTTITDPALPTLSVAPVTVEEGITASFAVTLSAAQATDLTVEWTTEDGTAEEGVDYAAVTAGPLILAGGATMGTIEVATMQDETPEPDEVFTVRLTGANLPAGVVLGRASATGTIRDDDASRAVAPPNAPDGLSATAGDGRVSLSWRAPQHNGGAAITHYECRVGTGTWESTGSISTDFAVRDLTNGQEYEFRVRAVNEAGAGPAAGPVSATPVAGTRGEPVRPLPSLSIGDARAVEGSGALRFALRLSEASSYRVTVDYATYGGTAEGGVDYEEAYGTVVFAPGERRRTITVRLFDDREDEQDETLEIALFGEANALLRDPIGTGTILDDDGPELTVADVSALETSGRISFTVRLSAPSVQRVTGSFSTRDGTATAGADYREAVGTFGIEPGAVNRRIVVALVDDRLDEDDETFLLELGRVRNATPADDEAVGTIEDDDEEPELMLADAAVTEGAGRIAFPVWLTAVSGRTVTVDYAMTDGSATGGVDYTATSGTLTFAAGDTDRTIVAVVLDDDLDEDDETFLLELGRVRNATPADDEAVGTIEDDDEEPELMLADAAATEGAGRIAFSVWLTAVSGRTVTVDYAMIDGSAAGGVDYTATSGTVTFAAGDTGKTIVAVVLDDDLDEDDETFAVALSGETNATLDDRSATGTIRDDDAEPGLTVLDARARESAGAMEFMATLEAVAGRDLWWQWATADGEALAGEDYEAQRTEFVIPAGETTQTLRVPLVDDGFDEAEESFTVALTNPRGSAPAPLVATGVIDDDDDNAGVVKMWITRFGRTVATQIMEAVEDRLEGASERGAHLTLGLSPTDTFFGWMPRAALGEGYRDLQAVAGGARGLDGREILSRSSFLVAWGDEDTAASGGDWAVWGGGAAMRFGGEGDGISVGGDVLTTTAGFDYRRGRVLAGVAVAHSVGEGPFEVAGSDTNGTTRDGSARGALSSASPYLRLSLGERISVWGLGGYGIGEITLLGDERESDLRMRLGAVGARGELWPGVGGSGLNLAVKSDMFWVRLQSDATAVRLASEGRAQRARLLVEGSWTLASVWGGELTPNLEAGLRYDGGDAETGAGVEVGSGIRFNHRHTGLTVELHARSLLAHQESAYREWGLGGTVQLDPGSKRRGLSVRFASTRGNALSGVGQLWRGREPLTFGAGAAGGPGRIEAEMGYGLGAFGQGSITPYAGFAWSDSENRAYRLGGRLQLGPSFLLSLEGDRRERAGLPEGYAIVVRASLR